MEEQEVELKYTCPYCNYVFNKKIRSTGTSKKGAGTDMVQCKICGNFLKIKSGE